MPHPTLAALGLMDVQPGNYLWQGERHGTGNLLTSENPASSEPLACVQAAAAADYETLLAPAEASFRIWRATPAPRRSEAIPPLRRGAAPALKRRWRR